MTQQQLSLSFNYFVLLASSLTLIRMAPSADFRLIGIPNSISSPIRLQSSATLKKAESTKIFYAAHVS